jgi:hypothetical protein
LARLGKARHSTARLGRETEKAPRKRGFLFVITFPAGRVYQTYPKCSQDGHIKIG